MFYIYIYKTAFVFYAVSFNNPEETGFQAVHFGGLQRAHQTCFCSFLLDLHLKLYFY